MYLYKEGTILIPILDEHTEEDIKNNGWPYKVIIVRKATNYSYLCRVFYKNSTKVVEVNANLLHDHFKKSFKEVLKKL